MKDGMNGTWKSTNISNKKISFKSLIAGTLEYRDAIKLACFIHCNFVYSDNIQVPKHPARLTEPESLHFPLNTAKD